MKESRTNVGFLWVSRLVPLRFSINLRCDPLQSTPRWSEPRRKKPYWWEETCPVSIRWRSYSDKTRWWLWWVNDSESILRLSVWLFVRMCALGPCTGLKSRPRPGPQTWFEAQARPGPGPQQLCWPGPARKLNYEARARPGPQQLCPGPARPAKQSHIWGPCSSPQAPGRAIGLTT